MKRKQLLSLFLAGAMTAGAASAGTPETSAVLKGVEGQVYVRKDETTEPAQDGLSVAPGNQVLTVEGSKAQLVYADGCTVTLPEYSLLAIGGPEQCRAGQAKVYSTAGFQEKAVGMTPAAFIAWVANTLGVSTTVATAAVVTGAGLIVGGVAYTASELSNKSGKSESEIAALFSNSNNCPIGQIQITDEPTVADNEVYLGNCLCKRNFLRTTLECIYTSLHPVTSGFYARTKEVITFGPYTCRHRAISPYKGCP